MSASLQATITGLTVKNGRLAIRYGFDYRDEAVSQGDEILFSGGAITYRPSASFQTDCDLSDSCFAEALSKALWSLIEQLQEFYDAISIST